MVAAAKLRRAQEAAERARPYADKLVDMFGAVDLRLVASGHVHQRRDFTYRHVRHVWAPSAGFVISDASDKLPQSFGTMNV